MAISTETVPAAPWLEPRSAYVHIPFCAHRCGYCDFAVTAGQDHLIDLYLEALELEMATPAFLPPLPRLCGGEGWGEGGESPRGTPNPSPQPSPPAKPGREGEISPPRSPLRSVFLGGGTPSHLSARQLERLFADLARHLPWESAAEVALEANPDSFDPDKAKRLADLGVNRVSIGVQSFQPHLLRILERRHDPAHIRPAVEAGLKHIGRVSVDLIFAVPGQTLEEWDADLRAAMAFGPEQISTYGLTFEKGTRLWKQQRNGAVRELGEDLEYRMYTHAMDVLEAAGYRQYEISSFARPGGCCRHNQVYWANEAFFGFGVGAAAYVNGTRTLNVRNTQEYIRRLFAGESPAFQSETLPPEDRARETLALNLRRAEGANRERFREQTGLDLDALAGPALRRHVGFGSIDDDGASVRLTRQGRCVADSVVGDLL